MELYNYLKMSNQLIKGVLVSQRFMHLTREDYQALSKQFCSAMF